MPTVKFNKKTIAELLGKKLSDQELSNRLSFLGTNVEGIDENEIAIEIFPNRPDLLSEQGIARALKSFLKIKTGFRKYEVKKSSVKVIIDKSVKNVRPYTACAVVKGLKLSDERIKEIIQIQEKLHVTYGRNRKKAAIGIYPLEHIKPPIYYKALHPEEIKFKPLDLNKELNGSQILAIHPTGREYGHLLEGNEKYPVFLDSRFQYMSMPPIINSNSVGKITQTTKEVFIECSGFDFDYLHTCLNILVTSLADMGGQIFSVELYYPDKKRVTPDLNGIDMKIDINYVNKILGLELKDADLKNLLEQMGYGYKTGKALVPGYRADVLHPIDLVEDIAVAYGYENFEGTIGAIATTSSEKPLEIFKRKITEVLIGLGLIEVKNYHLTNKDNQTKLMNLSADVVELANSVTQEYTALRYWVIPCLMETLKYNKHYEYPQNIFEIGTVFKTDTGSDTGVRESDRVAIALCGNDANFTKIKQILDSLMESLDVKYVLNDTEHTSFIKGRVGRVVVGDEKIATMGELHPQVLANWTIEMPVAVLELNITDLVRILHFPESVDKEEKVRESKKESSKPKKALSQQKKKSKKK
jgi:phenylalanyl-tRNA synthetase beta chain